MNALPLDRRPTPATTELPRSEHVILVTRAKGSQDDPAQQRSRRVLDDRKAKGFHARFLEILDDSRLPSRDAYGNVAFQPELDITRPVILSATGAK